MKYKEIEAFSFLLDKDHFAYDVKEDESILNIYVKSRPHSCRCPECGAESRELHNTYKRKIQDTPIRGKRVNLYANVYKYNCVNTLCPVKIFTETLSFAKTSQVRTDALNALILGVSMFLSNEGASKVLALMGVNVSNDTIKRIYDKIEFVDNPDVTGVGVDDVAIRKGQTYATAIYDLETHQLLALLEGRDGKPFKEWLKGHKKIRLVARDRASAYASAISEVLPDCVQVADRFHLLQNLLGYLKDIFKEEMPAEILIRDGEVLDKPPEKVLREKKPGKRQLEGLQYDNAPPVDPEGKEIQFDNKRRDLDSLQYRGHAESRKKNSNLSGK